MHVPNRPRRDVGHRGVLSMSALSYGVVKFDEDANLTSLSLQDCGNALPGGIIACAVILNDVMPFLML